MYTISKEDLEGYYEDVKQAYEFKNGTEYPLKLDVRNNLDGLTVSEHLFEIEMSKHLPYSA